MLAVIMVCLIPLVFLMKRPPKGEGGRWGTDRRGRLAI